MFYETEVKGFVRLHPKLFNKKTKEAIIEILNFQFENYVSKELGFVVAVLEVLEIKDGIMIPGDGAPYYDTRFKLITYKPELKEIILGRVSDITDFGAFIEIGAVDGMVHLSQTMDDYVTFSKSNVLTGKETKRVLKIGDKCRARIIAVSFKDISNPKIGLTMRQPRLGNLQWIEEEIKKEQQPKK